MPGIVLLAAVGGVFYIPINFEGVLALVAIWMMVGIIIGERMPREMSLKDYLTSKECVGPIVLSGLLYFGLLVVYAIRETATADMAQPFRWKGSEIYGFLVVGIGALIWGFLLGALLRRECNSD